MISWLPVAVVLLAVAFLAVATSTTPAIAESPIEPPARADGGDGPAGSARERPSSQLAAGPGANGSNLGTETGKRQHSETWKPKEEFHLAPIGQIERAATDEPQASAIPIPIPSKRPIYTNQFVIQVEGGELEARKLAEKHGFVYLNHILADYYHLEHQRLSKRSTSATQDALNISIEDEPQVLLLERQVLKRRVKRDFLELTNPANQAPAAIGTRLGAAAGANEPAFVWPAGASGGLGQVRQQGSINHQQNQQQQAQLSQQAHLAGSARVGGHAQANQRPTANMRLPHHHYTRPANQAANQPLYQHPQRVAIGRLLQPDGNSPSLHQPEVLETAATGSSLLYHQQQQQQSTANGLLGANGAPMKATNSSNGNRLAYANSTANGAAKQMPFNDPSWPLMWYLDGGAKNGFDLNVMAAWRMGYTGKGIVITILDDGLEKDHPDLQANYDPLASFDINGDDADPMPRYDVNDSNRHGTRCAGEVAAVPDNNICSIGIAYNSKVGGVRMLDGDVTDAVEARSLSLNNQHIHIYSASWGPDDNGKTVDGPGEMATRAFMEGVTNGRQGLGSIFVFASGNGGREHDNCNCDGYTNSIWTLSISSATENGYVPWYMLTGQVTASSFASERGEQYCSSGTLINHWPSKLPTDNANTSEACSSTLATTYSSGSYEERQIATTDLHHSCTSSHTGTSASAPLAAGICALVLESNPKLTWRDMQHIVVRTAKPANLVAKDWRTNALGRNVSHAFGYGLMDAAAMITMAKRWTTVPMQFTCEVRSPQMEKFIPAKGYIELKLSAACKNVSFLEHVQSKVTLTSSRRGDLHIYLVSPHGTRSTLLAQRPHDQAEQGFRAWPFMTVHSWGESPNGVWTLEVHNEGKPQNRAYLKEWTLVLHGTKEDPNRHLDTANLTPPPTSMLASLEPHHSVYLRPQAPANKQQVSSPLPPPPPPLPELANHYAADKEPDPMGPSQQPTTPAQVPAPGGRPGIVHWSIYSPPAPPPPPPLEPGSSPGSMQRPANVIPAPAPPSVPPSPQPPVDTTTSSYVTTFKTIVSTSSSSSSTQPTEAGNGAGSTGQRVQVTKADFEIVSPVNGQQQQPYHPMQSQPNTNHHHLQHHHHHHQHQKPPPAHTSTDRPPVETSRPSQIGDDLFEGPQTSSPPTSTTDQRQHNHHQDLGLQFNKPPMVHLDGNKIELPATPMKPPVGMHELQQQTGGQTSSQQQTPPTSQHELDGNQIDLKLSKDYRSSGDLSIYGTTVTVPTSTDTNYLAETGQSTNLSQNGAGRLDADNQLWPMVVSLAATVFIAICHSHSWNRNQRFQLMANEF